MEFAALGFDCTGTGLVEESSVAVWILSTTVHCVGSNARRFLDTWALIGW